MASIRTKHIPLPAIQVLLLLLAPFLLNVSLAQNCATAGCPAGNCCSKYGYCGTTSAYCGADCASLCPSPPSPPSGSGVGSIVTSTVFNSIFPSRNSFYTYNSFISATGSFASFGTTGSSDVKKREIAAFLAHVHHETGGLTQINEQNAPPGHYCQNSAQYPCASGQEYYGRGPLQISWNYNYGAAGAASTINQPLLTNPNLVSTNPTISFKTALWFWTTAQAPKPSSHDVMVGSWKPSADDTAAGRKAGFGETINIINGGLECGPNTANAAAAQNRVTQYKNICSKLSVDPGSNLDCTTAKPYGS